MLKGCLIAIASIVFLILVAVFGGYYLLTYGLADEEMVAVSISKEAAQTFDQKLQRFDSELKVASPGQKVTLAITEEEANSKVAELIEQADLNQRIREAGLPIELDINNVKLNFRDDRVKAMAMARISGIEAKIGVQALVNVQDGRLSVNVEDIQFGRLPLPEVLKDQLSSVVSERIESMQLDLPIKLEDVSLQYGQLVIKGVVR